MKRYLWHTVGTQSVDHVHNLAKLNIRQNQWLIDALFGVSLGVCTFDVCSKSSVTSTAAILCICCKGRVITSQGGTFYSV